MGIKDGDRVKIVSTADREGISYPHNSVKMPIAGKATLPETVPVSGA